MTNSTFTIVLSYLPTFFDDTIPLTIEYIKYLIIFFTISTIVFFLYQFQCTIRNMKKKKIISDEEGEQNIDVYEDEYEYQQRRYIIIKNSGLNLLASPLYGIAITLAVYVFLFLFFMLPLIAGILVFIFVCMGIMFPLYIIFSFLFIVFPKALREEYVKYRKYSEKT